MTTTRPASPATTHHRPWGHGDPITWALSTGRITATSAGKWSADLEHDRATTEYVLAGLFPALADSARLDRLEAQLDRPLVEQPDEFDDLFPPTDTDSTLDGYDGLFPPGAS